MRKLVSLLVTIGLLSSTVAFAAGPPCRQATDLACGSGTPSTQNISTAWTLLTGVQLTLSNLGSAYNESDTNPTCSAGDFNIYADASENKLKKCENGTLTDLDTSAGGSSAWSALTAPTGNLSLAMGANTSTFTSGAATGAGVNVWSIIDTTGNTGTGYLVDFHTVGSSVLKPFVVTAGGTANGIEVSNAGLLLPKGTGGIQSSDVVCTGCVGSTDLAAGAVLLSNVGDPGANKAFAMGNNTLTFTYGTATGASTNAHVIRDSAGNTGTGAVLAVNSATTSAAFPMQVTALGTSNGVRMDTTGLLAPLGTGGISATDLACTGCVSTTDIATNGVDTAELADNSVTGAKIAITSQATGDLMFYNGTDWVQLAAGTATEVLHGGTTPSFGVLVAADLTAGVLANVMKWNETPTGTWPNFTLASTPRTADTAIVNVNALFGVKVASCAGGLPNEYTLSGTTLTMCDSGGSGTVRVTYEI